MQTTVLDYLMSVFNCDWPGYQTYGLAAHNSFPDVGECHDSAEACSIT